MGSSKKNLIILNPIDRSYLFDNYNNLTIAMKINRQANNFDLIRFLLAVVVVIAHTASFSQTAVFLKLEEIFNPKAAVDGFFIISGFLIFMSFERSSSLSSYIKKRSSRILPGYISVIVICAFALFFVSNVNFKEYFNLEFVKYIFFNLLTFNFLQPTLPGVFETHSTSAINHPLWTIKVEIMFYIVVPFIAYILTKTNKLLGIIIIYFLSILYSTVILQLSDRLQPDLLIQLEQQLPGQMAFFISGALLYYYYEKFSNNILFILPIAVFILIIHNKALEIYFLYPLALAVVVIYFSLIFKYLGNFGKYGDFSYGIYIWHFPIIQVFVHYKIFETPWLGIPLSFICILLVSFLSWHWIEKPFLSRRSHYVVAETNNKEYVTK
ncbi:MAG: acyltransferase family protein [Waterburya sp.]